MLTRLYSPGRQIPLARGRAAAGHLPHHRRLGVVLPGVAGHCRIKIEHGPPSFLPLGPLLFWLASGRKRAVCVCESSFWGLFEMEFEGSLEFESDWGLLERERESLPSRVDTSSFWVSVRRTDRSSIMFFIKSNHHTFFSLTRGFALDGLLVGFFSLRGGIKGFLDYALWFRIIVIWS